MKPSARSPPAAACGTRAETAPASFGSDEVALTVLAAELLPDGSTSSLQRLRKRFDDVDSGESRNIESVVFSQSQAMVGVALTVIGYEVDSERAFNQQIESFEEAFVDYLSRAWDKFKGALTYREFREYHSEEEESRYDLFLRYNRIA